MGANGTWPGSDLATGGQGMPASLPHLGLRMAPLWLHWGGTKTLATAAVMWPGMTEDATF